MLVPFQRETLDGPLFAGHSVRFNLLYRISEGELATALQAEDGGAVALQTPGRTLWLWINPERSAEYSGSVICGLVERLTDKAIPAMTAAPEHAVLFARAYSKMSGRAHKLHFRLMAYHCPQVRFPSGVSGSIERAGECHAETVAELYFGFNQEIFGTHEDRDDMLEAALAMIRAGSLFLWNVNGKTVSMAAIAHRTSRLARVNAVFTAAEQRKKGYASALVATVSQMALDEGLMPMLYADMSNPDSNKVYCSLGYISSGEIDEYSFV